MMEIQGKCHCGKVSVRVRLTDEPETYAPRACDCDFCTRHGARYLSDPKGSLEFEVADESGLSRYRQGAELADMLFCSNCGILVGACYEDDSGLFGVVNARLFPQLFGEETVVSPKQLGPEEKTERWKKIWFGDMRIGPAE